MQNLHAAFHLQPGQALGVWSLSFLIGGQNDENREMLYVSLDLIVADSRSEATINHQHVAIDVTSHWRAQENHLQEAACESMMRTVHIEGEPQHPCPLARPIVAQVCVISQGCRKLG